MRKNKELEQLTELSEVKTALEEYGAIANSKLMAHRKQQPYFDKVLYQLLDRIEQFFNKFK